MLYTLNYNVMHYLLLLLEKMLYTNTYIKTIDCAKYNFKTTDLTKDEKIKFKITLPYKKKQK